MGYPDPVEWVCSSSLSSAEKHEAGKDGADSPTVNFHNKSVMIVDKFELATDDDHIHESDYL